MRLLNLILQDFKLIIKDRRTFIILILMPTVLVVLLGSVFQNSFSMEIDAFKVAYLSNDAPVLHREAEVCLGNTLREDFFKSDEIKKIINLEEVGSFEKGKKLVENGEVSVFVYVEEGFSKKYLNEEATEVKIIADNRQATHASIVRSIVDRFNDVIRTTETSVEGIADVLTNSYKISDKKLGDIIGNVVGSSNADNTNIPKEAGNNKKPVSAMHYYSIAMVVMYAMFTAQNLLQSMIEEKKNKTYFRIQASPVSRLEYITGKLAGIVLVMIAQMFVLILITSLFFGMEWGNLLHILIITVAYSLPIGALVMILGFISDDDRMISNLSMPIVFVFSFLGGSFIPRAIMPDFVKQLQEIVPNGVALIGFLNIAQGNGFSSLIRSISILLGLAVVFFIIVVYVAWRKGWKDGSIIRNNKASVKTAVQK